MWKFKILSLTFVVLILTRWSNCKAKNTEAQSILLELDQEIGKKILEINSALIDILKRNNQIKKVPAIAESVKKVKDEESNKSPFWYRIKNKFLGEIFYKIIKEKDGTLRHMPVSDRAQWFMG